ncbi:hypothetical protein F5879DRAFT_323174 [Lentinula edodes]|uniref:uncharacterized protein n=1 Tax=Lentinula edodes TaxID=5353 RepID=UPI001E8CE5DD|nr:uncharacterized protein C8R40DRAFT_837260 [Lentinula edodes]KAH7868437.1 hypothetical protein C8R40DRAFT_837260 [Lentinula edodes]KAJ3901461.1 hypothetical protein F5879DRAFT_323174 [Lentinula edodes]
MRLSATLFIFGLASITCTGAAPQPMNTRAHANALDTADAERRIRSLTVPSMHARNEILEVYYRQDTKSRQPMPGDDVRSKTALKDFFGHEGVRQHLGISEGIEIEVKGDFYGFLKYNERGITLPERVQKVAFKFKADPLCRTICAGLLEINSMMGVVRNEEKEIFKNFYRG